MKHIVFSKKQVEMLKEGNAYVQPNHANASSESIPSDIAKARRENPTDDKFVLDTSDYDGDASNNEPMFKIQAKNEADAGKKIQDLRKNPNLTKAMKDAQIEVQLQKEGVVKYTKKELNKILFN